MENDLCETEHSAVRHYLLNNTGPTNWQKVSMNLKAGVNVLSWHVYSPLAEVASIATSNTVKIRLIEVRGNLAALSCDITYVCHCVQTRMRLFYCAVTIALLMTD